MKYIFIDESGELGKDSNYFVIICIILDKNLKNIERIITKLRHKYPKELNKMVEFKGTKTKNRIIKEMLKKLNYYNPEIYAVVFNKSNKWKIEYMDNKNLLYDLISCELAKQIKIDSTTSIYIDKSKTNMKDINNFNKLFMKNLNNKNKFSVKMYHVNSRNYKGIQIADSIAWSVFQSVERNNPEFIDLIKNIHIKRVYED